MKRMTIAELLRILYPPSSPRQLTPDQTRILNHPRGPAWVLAGPGSGKTEVLAIMVLRLIFVEDDPIQSNRFPVESVLVTTFTEKAARNLEDRINAYRDRIVAVRPDLAQIDVSRLKIGTLHGLCNDILQEYRATNYQNVRLMDDFETSMFIYEHLSAFRDTATRNADVPFFRSFGYLFRDYDWPRNSPHPPNKWNATAALAKLFERIVDDQASVTALRAAGGVWAHLADLYDEYTNALVQYHRCDFAHLQLRLLEFLRTPIGQQFVNGNGTDVPGVNWVLVDEYQDTNLIQESIYFSLSQRQPHNLVVVGDDDQAMYRFRGGSVECMVTFDDACRVYFGPNTSVVPYPLVDNFRSHQQIVVFCDSYITAFPAMHQVGARVPNKPSLVPRSRIAGAYPAVGRIEAQTVRQAATVFAQTVADLLLNSVISDYSQCCLLLRSTKETPYNAKPYADALQDLGIPVYNPRNKAFLDQEEVQGLLGAILAITDPDSGVQIQTRDIIGMIAACRTTFGNLARIHPDLANYVSGAVQNMAAHPDDYVPTNLQEIVYLILSRDPFSTWQADPVRRVRLAKITALVESFASMPVPGRPNANRGRLRTPLAGQRGVLPVWNLGFYNLFFGYLSRSGLDEEEDEQVICPPGMVPIMTMHQAKGLEFPFVFVGHMSASASANASHKIETALSAFPTNAARAFVRLPEDIRAQLDLIRQYYVAYSRAEHALILVGSRSQFTKGEIPCGPNQAWLRNNSDRL